MPQVQLPIVLNVDVGRLEIQYAEIIGRYIKIFSRHVPVFQIQKTLIHDRMMTVCATRMQRPSVSIEGQGRKNRVQQGCARIMRFRQQQDAKATVYEVPNELHLHTGACTMTHR